MIIAKTYDDATGLTTFKVASEWAIIAVLLAAMRLRLDDDDAFGADAPVTQPQLRAYLDTTQQMSPVPELHLQPDATARYEVVDEVLHRARHARLG